VRARRQARGESFRGHELQTRDAPCPRAGWEILHGTEQISESHSVDAASKICEKRASPHCCACPWMFRLSFPTTSTNSSPPIAWHRFDNRSLARWHWKTNAILRLTPTLFPLIRKRKLGEASCRSGNAHARVTIRHNARLWRWTWMTKPICATAAEPRLDSNGNGRLAPASGV